MLVRTDAPHETHARSRPTTFAGLLVAAGLLIALVLAATACGGGQSSAQGGVEPPAATHAPLSPPLPVSLEDRTAVEQQVAARLRLDPAQIRAQLQAEPNATLMTLAKPLGLAQDALGPIILAAVNDRADAALRSGTWTAPQANQEEQFWTAQTQPDLIAEISRWFRES
ncbi:hypothetical protein [Frankia sp. Cr1]|uniref:hypothetical protein n=1 Tax=Frankia sp. Cr1 TaxID=3073931 RepID=UPI002AD235BF|nr:hypothetical protein [Frankia sp. Cr1]